MKQRTFLCIGVHEAEALLQRDDLLILDMRDIDSFKRAHIKGAQHVTIANLFAIAGGTERKRPILIYCYHGYASREYAQLFADFRFPEVYSLNGGYEAWGAWLRAAGSTALDDVAHTWLSENGFPSGGVDAVAENGMTPLMRASRDGPISVVRALIAAGAPLNARNADGNNALWLACVGQNFEIIDALIEAGIDIDNRNDNGATALMYAASSGRAGIVERLLMKGADPTPETLDGFTALDLAATVECLALLRRRKNTKVLSGGARARLESVT